MTREDIICMVQETIFAHPNDNPFDFQIKTIEQLQYFAALVAAAEREQIISKNAPVIEQINAHIKTLEDAVAAEREACAKVCEEVAEAVTYQRNSQAAADKCAEAIRARGQT